MNKRKSGIVTKRYVAYLICAWCNNQLHSHYLLYETHVNEAFSRRWFLSNAFNPSRNNLL